MRSIFRPTRIRLLGVLIAGILLGIFAAPVWRMVLVQLNQDRYGQLTYLCDSAMRAHDLARARANAAPSEDAVEQVHRAEIGLIGCQDYDMLQKRLIVWGLRENELGLMRLRAAEENADGLRQVVEAHEIRR